MKRISRSRPIRRSKNAILDIKTAIIAVLEEDQPCTVRQVFYRLVSARVIEKSEAAYKNVVIRLLSQMRRDAEIPFSYIADNGRWMRKPQSFSSLESMLKQSAEAYRRSVWDDQFVYCEVWSEKDALAGVLYDVTAAWDVPLMVSRGFASLSFLHSAAETINEQAWNGKATYIYYFGDHDPSGVLIDKVIERDLHKFAPHAEIHVERVAVTLEQIEELNLLTRPTKKKGTHSKSFVGESVEVDAIPPRVLQQMAEKCITQHIDQNVHSLLLTAEESERDTLMAIARQHEGLSNDLTF